MIPFNGYPRPYGSFSEPVAIPATEPDAGSQVCVQFGRNWLPYVLGALQQLLLQSTWIYTTKTELLEVQGSVFNLIAMFGNAIDTGDCLTEPTFRQPDDCSLQVSIDGGATWATIFDARACAIGAADNQIAEGIAAGILGGPTQLPPTTPPIPLACWTYHVTLTGNGVFKIPFALNDGWTVQITNAKGGWYDGNLLAPWFCPDGNEYQLGDCLASSGTTDTADPLPTQNHMELLFQYGSVFVPAYNTTYAIPSGTGSTDGQFRANDSVLSDNAGSIEFDLTVCNESVVIVCPEVLDFTTGQHHTDANGDNTVTPYGYYGGGYASGVGYQSTPTVIGGYSGVTDCIEILDAISMTTVDSVITYGNNSDGTTDLYYFVAWQTDDNAWHQSGGGSSWGSLIAVGGVHCKRLLITCSSTVLSRTLTVTGITVGCS
jgi:hypothetical protein